MVIAPLLEPVTEATPLAKLSAVAVPKAIAVPLELVTVLVPAPPEKVRLSAVL
jgi:hypothetical protein